MPNAETVRAREALLQWLCSREGLDYESILVYLTSRLMQDEVMRSEAKALEWASKKYGVDFISTAGVVGDLVSCDSEYRPTNILVEVTTSPTADLAKKSAHSLESYSSFYPERMRISKVVAVRTSTCGTKVLEFEEIDVPAV